MATIRIATALLAAAGLAAASAAEAQNAVYEGDCNRARIVQAESTIDKLMPYTRYKGGQVLHFAENDKPGCPIDSLAVFNLTQTSRSTSAVVFSTSRNDVGYGISGGVCSAPATMGFERLGSVTFETKLETKDGRCELYIHASWKDSLSNFNNRVVPLAGGSFVLAQGTPSTSRQLTPMGFVGIP